MRRSRARAIARRRPADNPFAASRIDAVAYRLRDESWISVQRRLSELGGRAAVVGPHGSGKTAFLTTLARRLQSTGLEPTWIRLRADTEHPLRSALAQLPSSPLDRRAVLVDGAERLGPMSFRRVAAATRSAPVLVVSRHRAGRLPVLHRCGTSAALLAEIVAELAPEDASALLPLVPELFRRHRGNLRECLRELYDVCGGRAAALPDHRVKSER